MTSSATIFGLVAFVISAGGSFVYIRSIFQGKTRPHVFTHLVWGIITAIAFFAQLHDHAGPGAWATGITAAACLFQAVLALKYGEKEITLTDKVALGLSLSSVAAWVVTKDPLLSVVLASIVNVFAFYPNCRKSWRKPWEENLPAYNIASVKLVLSLFAITHMTFVTMLYPVSSLAVNILFVAACEWRRRSMAGVPVAA